MITDIIWVACMGDDLFEEMILKKNFTYYYVFFSIVYVFSIITVIFKVNPSFNDIFKYF